MDSVVAAYITRMDREGADALKAATADACLSADQYFAIKNEWRKRQAATAPFSRADLPPNRKQTAERIESKKLLRHEIERVASGRLADGSIDPNSYFAREQQRLQGQIELLQAQLGLLILRFNEAPAQLAAIDAEIAQLEQAQVAADNADAMRELAEMHQMLTALGGLE